MTEAKPRSPFPSTFWVANVMELFERAAYYGMNSVLAVYLAGSVAEGGLGFGEQSVGFLQSIVYAATYVLPILGGALADRYGYRRMLLVAFSLLAAGYFAAGHVSTYALVFLSLLVMATGSGLFKPIISGTIARTTDESNSAFGFGIYYWMINLGAFLAPLVVSVLKGFSWRYVFVASALYTGLMLLPTVFVFRDPPRPQSTKTLQEVLMGAAEVLADARFMLMIVVYSGFWVLYFQNFGSVLWYLRDFVDRAPVSAAVTSLLRGPGPPLDLHLRRRARHRHQRRHHHPAAGARQPPGQGLEAAAHDGDRHGAGGGRLPAARLLPQPLGLRPRHRGLLDRRDDGPPEVLQLRRPGGARRPQGRLHGLRLPLRRLRARCSARASGPSSTSGCSSRPSARRRPTRGRAPSGCSSRPSTWSRRPGSSSSPAASVRTPRRRGAGRARSCAGSTPTVLLIGGVFLYVAFSSTPVQARTAVQAVIFIALGAGGLLMGAGTRPPTAR